MVWRFIKKLKIRLPYDPSIPVLNPKELKLRPQRDTCTPIFCAALLTCDEMWKQPYVHRWMNRLKNDTQKHTRTNVQLEKNKFYHRNNMNESGGWDAKWDKPGKDEYCRFSLVCAKYNQTHRSRVERDEQGPEGWGKWGGQGQRVQVSVVQDKFWRSALWHGAYS